MATLEVILTEDIGRLGNAGDVVKVRAGYGRNFLLPQGKAMLATVARVHDIEHKQRVIEEKQKKAVSGFEGIARRAAAVVLKFEAQASPEGKLFGSVTNADIAARLAEAGVEVERRKIVLAEPIKQIGDHEVTLRLHREVAVPLKVEVVSSGIVELPPEEEEDANAPQELEPGQGSANPDDET